MENNVHDQRHRGGEFQFPKSHKERDIPWERRCKESALSVRCGTV